MNPSRTCRHCGTPMRTDEDPLAFDGPLPFTAKCPLCGAWYNFHPEHEDQPHDPVRVQQHCDQPLEGRR